MHPGSQESSLHTANPTSELMGPSASPGPACSVSERGTPKVNWEVPGPRPPPALSRGQLVPYRVWAGSMPSTAAWRAPTACRHRLERATREVSEPTAPGPRAGRGPRRLLGETCYRKSGVIRLVPDSLTLASRRVGRGQAACRRQPSPGPPGPREMRTGGSPCQEAALLDRGHLQPMPHQLVQGQGEPPDQSHLPACPF